MAIYFNDGEKITQAQLIEYLGLDPNVRYSNEELCKLAWGHPSIYVFFLNTDNTIEVMIDG